MPDLALKERLQPSLLDRLTDHAPEQVHESREARVLNERQLRGLVRRDLSWLFNTMQLASVTELERFDEVRRSVLNFGVPDLAGRTLSSIEPSKLERLVREAIWHFEPRLLRRTVKVHVARAEEGSTRNAIVFHIEAQLWAEPLPLPMYLRTEFDLESGRVVVDELGPEDT